MSQIKQKKAQMSVVCTKSCCGKQWCASVCNDMMRVCVCAKVLSHSFLCILFPRRQTFFKVLLSNNSPGFWSSLLLDTVMCCSVLVKWGKLRIIICGESYRFYCTTGTCGTCCCWYLGRRTSIKMCLQAFPPVHILKHITATLTCSVCSEHMWPVMWQHPVQK